MVRSRLLLSKGHLIQKKHLLNYNISMVIFAATIAIVTTLKISKYAVFKSQNITVLQCLHVNKQKGNKVKKYHHCWDGSEWLTWFEGFLLPFIIFYWSQRWCSFCFSICSNKLHESTWRWSVFSGSPLIEQPRIQEMHYSFVLTHAHRQTHCRCSQIHMLTLLCTLVVSRNWHQHLAWTFYSWVYPRLL